MLCTNMGVGGGAEEQVIQLSYSLKGRGWQVMIVSLLPPSPMPPDFARSNIPLHHLRMRRGIPDPRGLYRLALRIGEFKPDIIHSHLTHANLLGRIVRLIAPYRVSICTQHALDMAGVTRKRTAPMERAHRWTDAMADHTTAICRAAASYCVERRAVPAHKMSVVYNGIETTRFARDMNARRRLRRELAVAGQFVWLAAGRLEAAKAYPTLLRAFAQLGDNAGVLLICGQGSLKNELLALADALHVASRVKFLGLRPDMPEMMSAADAFVLSSDSEGLPLVLLQASAAGLPIVATDVGGNGEAVVDQVTGLLVPPGNPSLFAGAMRELSSLPASDRAAMGQAGLERVQRHFDAGQVADQWEAVYADLLARSPVPRRLAVQNVKPTEEDSVTAARLPDAAEPPVAKTPRVVAPRISHGTEAEKRRVLEGNARRFENEGPVR
jgi:glycosyltransferase involved in cell wall biosynthesis